MSRRRSKFYVEGRTPEGKMSRLSYHFAIESAVNRAKAYREVEREDDFNQMHRVFKIVRVRHRGITLGRWTNDIWS